MTLWSRGKARASIMGHERTHNPTPAAYSLLGKRRVARAKTALRKRGRRRTHPGNPLPAVVGVLGGVQGIIGGTRLKGAAALQGVRQQMVDAAVAAHRAGQAYVTVTNPKGKPESGAPLALLQHWAQGMATPEGRAYAAAQLANLKANPVSAPAAPSTAQQAAAIAGALAVPIVREAAKASRPKRQRYPTYTDRYGRQRYSTKPPGAELRIPQGATPTAGSPYSFFRGAVGKGGAAATAGQVAVAGAAGIAAYLVTQAVLKHLGGRAQRQEEAGVNAALAFREARAQFQQQQGRAPNASEMAAMKRQYQEELVKLGYDPVTFTRTRSGFETFVETYNPFGG